MKNILVAIGKSISTFVTTHTAVAVTTAAVVATTAVAVPVGIHMTSSGKAPVDTASQTATVDDEQDVTVSSETATSSEANESEEALSESASSEKQEAAESKKDTTSEKETSSKADASSQKESSIDNKDETETTENESKTTTGNTAVTPTVNNNPVVQMADPATGISWDGKSQIVYTYTDGTTGTEKKPGATYEQVPGVFGTVIDENAPKEEYDPHCEDCGKIMGDGTGGTCLSYWTGGDHNCPNCGETVPVKTCHTCSK